MRFVTLVFSALVLTAASSPGAGIRYDQVPADVTGYAHADFDHLVSSRWLRAATFLQTYLYIITLSAMVTRSW